MESPIPAPYRIFFATIDPLVASSGVFLNFFDPAEVLHSYNAKATIPPAIETKILLDTSTGFLLGTMFLQIVLLRVRPKDIIVWRCLQASIALVDVAIIGSTLDALNGQSRLDPNRWRFEEKGSLGLTGFVLAVRLLFLLGVGIPRSATEDLKWE